VSTEVDRAPGPVETGEELGHDDVVEPWWLVAGLVAALSGLAVAGTVGLALAVAAKFDTLLVAAIGVPIWIGLIVLAWPLVRHARGRPIARHMTAATVCALVFLAVWGAWNLTRTSQHVVIERDPGMYTNTARWIAQDGSLEVDVSRPPFGGQQDLDFGSVAIYRMPDEVLQFQFTHFAPVLYAEAQSVGGDRLMFRVSVLISALALLALFALALRVLRQPWLALLTMVALAVCLPQVWFSRDTYSEIPMQALLLGGFWLLALSRRSTRLGPSVVTGALFGAMASTRIDAPLLLIAPVVVLGVEWFGTRRDDRRVTKLAGAFVLGGLVPVGVGILDLATRTGYYDSVHGHQYRAVWAATFAALIGVTIVVALRDRLPGVRSWLAARREAIGIVGGAGLAASLVFLWGPRRLISEPRKKSTNATMRAIELREGVRPATGTYTHAERSVEWMVWHMGVVAVVLGIVGAAILAFDLVRRRRRDALGLFVAFCTAGLLYLWKPTIFPDQPWAMRRYLPVLLPGMFLFAAVAISSFVGWLDRRTTRVVSLVVGAVLAAGLILPSAIGTWPVRNMRAQAGYIRPILWTCEQVGADGAILVLPSETQLTHRTLPQAFRSWCGVPVAIASTDVTPERVQELSKLARAAGRELYLVAGEPERLEEVGARKIRLSPVATNPDALVMTLGKRPDTLETEMMWLLIGKA